MSSFTQVNIDLFEGFKVTLQFFALTLLFSLPLGLVITAGSMSKFRPLAFISRIFVWIIRGTPLLLQILVVFFAPGILFGNPIFANNRFGAALITFVINYAAYFSEIYRGGFESIDEGQWEAGKVLGMKKSEVFLRVVLLQVIKRIIPSISNEVITLVKDTSLVRVISVIEIIRVAERYTAKGMIWPLFYTGLYYLVFCGFLTVLFAWIEKKLDYFKG